jgi:hypothetical protein
MPWKAALLILATAVVGFASGAGCRSGGGCQDGTCDCPTGASCELECSAPPCHATCDGNNQSCSAVCANGTCTCGTGSSCHFECAAPPCHVTCAAKSTCEGTCANGQCTCGAGSTCIFTCSASPCHTSCAAGAHCLVNCPAGLAGTQACDIVDCSAGSIIVCPDGKTTTCGQACP